MKLENQFSTLPAPADTLRQQQMQQQFSWQKAQFMANVPGHSTSTFARLQPWIARSLDWSQEKLKPVV